MTLKSLLVLIAATILGAAMLVLGLFLQRGIETYGQTTAVRAVEVRAQALGTYLSRALYEEWRAIESLAERLSRETDPEVLRGALDALSDQENKVSWVGIAQRDGTVLAATQGLLEGEDVSQRPWFQAGLEGAFAGDVHEAVLLARLLGNDSSEPLRFIDFSAPILDAEGNVTGVLGAHLDWRWVRALVSETASQLELDAFLVNSVGSIILATDTVTETTPNLATFRAATLGVADTFSETWDDGEAYFAAAIPDFGYQSLPSFGWKLVARIDPDFVVGAERQFSSTMLTGAVLAFLVGILIFALVLISLLRPLSAMAETVLKVAKGEPVGYVREHRRFRELNALSEAVVRLQSAHGGPQR